MVGVVSGSLYRRTHSLSRLVASAAAWRHSTFIKWTGWTLAMALPWWQHHKHCRAYYYYYYVLPFRQNTGVWGGDRHDSRRWRRLRGLLLGHKLNLYLDTSANYTVVVCTVADYWSMCELIEVNFDDHWLLFELLMIELRMRTVCRQIQARFMQRRATR